MTKDKQIGCGYCAKEKDCKIRDPKTNKAKQGCKEWEHFEVANCGCLWMLPLKNPNL